jgi:DnaK suppressor protein
LRDIPLPAREMTMQEMKNSMSGTDLTRFAQVLRAKKADSARSGLGLEEIAVERTADEHEEAERRFERELAIDGLNRKASVRRSIAMALARIDDHTYGICIHCGEEISRRRLEAVPWTPFCIRCQEAADIGDESVLESLGQRYAEAA